MKAIICVGDSTTHGGEVITGTGKLTLYGKQVACKGDMVACPKCKGVYPIIEGVEQSAIGNKKIAVEGMKTACGATLIASQTTAGVK